MRPEIKFFPDLGSLSQEAAGFLAGYAEECVRRRKIFTWVLSGGKTPQILFERLARPPLRERIPWSRTHLFWGDERCVGPDHPQSNYGLALHSLLAKVPLSPAQVHRIPAEQEPCGKAAEAYEQELRQFFPRPGSVRGSPGRPKESPHFPFFDLILLGLGRDGHTASLFPGSPVLEEKKRWVAYVPPPDIPPRIPRITLTLPVINRADCVLFLVSGSEKGPMVQWLLKHPRKAARTYPAARVNPPGRLIWFINQGEE